MKAYSDPDARGPGSIAASDGTRTMRNAAKAAAAARVGDIMVAHRLGVASTWKSSAQLGDVPDPLVGAGADAQKAGV